MELYCACYRKLEPRSIEEFWRTDLLIRGPAVDSELQLNQTAEFCSIPPLCVSIVSLFYTVHTLTPVSLL